MRDGICLFVYTYMTISIGAVRLELTPSVSLSPRLHGVVDMVHGLDHGDEEGEVGQCLKGHVGGEAAGGGVGVGGSPGAGQAPHGRGHRGDEGHHQGVAAWGHAVAKARRRGLHRMRKLLVV